MMIIIDVNIITSALAWRMQQGSKAALYSLVCSQQWHEDNHDGRVRRVMYIGQADKTRLQQQQ